MRSHDVRATTAGVLFIAATAASLLATAFFGSLLEGSDLLAGVAAHQDRVLVGALFQILSAFTSAAIAISLYPVLRKYAAGMALGAVAFRLIEGVFYALSAAGTLILVSLSGQLTAGASAHASADLVRDLRDSASCVGVLAFYTGATLYYLVFYRSQLIPRWLSVWGLAGTVLGLAAGLLVLFQSIALLSGTQVVLNLPIAVQEMVLAVWLIVKGFSPKAKAQTRPRPVCSPSHGENPKNTPSAYASAVRAGVSCVCRSAPSQRRRRGFGCITGNGRNLRAAVRWCRRATAPRPARG